MKSRTAHLLEFFFRMKRGALKRSARHISVVLVVLVCATVGIWTWDSNPTTAFLPPESRILKLETGLTMTLKLLFLPHTVMSVQCWNNATLILYDTKIFEI